MLEPMLYHPHAINTPSRLAIDNEIGHAESSRSDADSRSCTGRPGSCASPDDACDAEMRHW